MKTITIYPLVVFLVLASVMVANPQSGPANPKAYVYFALNINDFRHVDQSAAYVGRILDLFSRDHLGIDLYFTEPVLKAFQRYHPELIDRIKGYPQATINYHIRPPHPCILLRLRDQSGQCRPLASFGYGYLRREISNFESYELVVNDYHFPSRDYCPHYNPARVGGVDYVKQVFGTTPIFGGRVPDPAALRVWASVLKGKGVQGIVAPPEGGAGGNQPFRMVYGLLARPADFDCPFSRIADTPNPYQALISRLPRFSGYPRPIFGNVLAHDYEFYHRGDWLSDELPAHRFGDWRKSGQEQAAYWRAYENLVKGLAANPEIRIINAKDLVAMSGRFYPR